MRGKTSWRCPGLCGRYPCGVARYILATRSGPNAGNRLGVARRGGASQDSGVWRPSIERAGNRSSQAVWAGAAESPLVAGRHTPARTTPLRRPDPASGGLPCSRPRTAGGRCGAARPRSASEHPAGAGFAEGADASLPRGRAAALSHTGNGRLRRHGLGGRIMRAAPRHVGEFGLSPVQGGGARSSGGRVGGLCACLAQSGLVCPIARACRSASRPIAEAPGVAPAADAITAAARRHAAGPPVPRHSPVLAATGATTAGRLVDAGAAADRCRCSDPNGGAAARLISFSTGTGRGVETFGCRCSRGGWEGLSCGRMSEWR